MSRWVARVLVVAVVGSLLAGCSSRDTDLEEVRAAIGTTRRSIAAFVYSDERVDRQVRVQGLVEDDFRFKASVAINGAPTYEQVVNDDTLAVRFIDAGRLRELLAPNAAEADLETELDGVTSLEVLRSRRWVVDATGAPLLSASSVSVEELGRNPVLDALTALDYVETALTQAQSVDEWSEDAFDPTYPSSEDDFPAPEGGSGVTRYDLRRPDLPPISSAGTGDAQGVALPAARHFREMAIYVKDGRIVRILERIEASGKRLEDFLDYTRVALEEFNVGEEIRANFEAGVAQATTEEELAQLLFAAINIARKGIGEPPITTRVMSLSLPELEQGDETTVALPTANAVQGSLAAMVASAEAQEFFLQGEEQGGGGAPGDLLDAGAVDSPAPAGEPEAP